MPNTDKRPLKVFPSTGSGQVYATPTRDRDPVRALPEGTRLTKDGVDAWLDKEICHLLSNRFRCIL